MTHNDGLTNAEQGSLAWMAVKGKFQQTDNGCQCPPCNTIRMMIATEDSRMNRQNRTGTEAERRLRFN